jgi:DEAD/DEAH box helicase domain-containing protein
MKNLVGLELADIAAVTEDGAPSGQKYFLIWNPPFKDPVTPSLGRRSSLLEATNLMRHLMKRGIKVILFCKV